MNTRNSDDKRTIGGRSINNPQYINASRVAFWVVLFLALPLFLYRVESDGPSVGNLITFLIYCYLLIGNYILGYRLDNVPAWAKFVIPQKWIDEWQQLSCANPDEIKDNQTKLIRLAGGVAILFIILLAGIYT